MFFHETLGNACSERWGEVNRSGSSVPLRIVELERSEVERGRQLSQPIRASRLPVRLCNRITQGLLVRTKFHNTLYMFCTSRDLAAIRSSNFRTVVELFKFRTEAKSPRKSPHLCGNTIEPAWSQGNLVTFQRDGAQGWHRICAWVLSSH